MSRSSTYSPLLLYLFPSSHFSSCRYDEARGSLGWTKGGFQGARGDDVGAEWYVENVFSLLDAPNEYFFDGAGEKLYYFHNGTGAPPAELAFEVPTLQTLAAIRGTQVDPVCNVSFHGVTFRDAAYTYMEPHGVPSGGDWALQRMGALFVEGAESVGVDSCLFTRVDGNALFLSGYVRGAVVEKNEFVWTGDSVMASWGYTAPLGTDSAGDRILAQYKSGIDGTGGEQPRGTRVIGNLVHELGHFEKQSSPWFQAKTAQTLLQGNIFYNMPRAGINFNDGFGGGSVVTENLLWNTCRESSDHANFNSWDRQPFLTDVLDGTPSLTPAFNEIHHNFLIGNDGAVNTIDNDDGSSWYRHHDNYLVYGGHKSNFGGHNKFSYNNINVNAKVYQDGACLRVNAENIGNYTDGYYNCTCVQDKDGLAAYSLRYCNASDIGGSALPIIHDNRIFNPSGKMTVTCGNGHGTLITEEQLQAAGKDPGTTVGKTPSVDTIINWGRLTLGIAQA